METVLKDSFYETISIHQNQEHIVSVQPHSKGTLLVTIASDARAYALQMNVQASANIKVFIYNQARSAFDLNIKVNMYQDAVCQMGFLDMEDAPVDWHHFVDLVEPGARYEILSGQLCMSNQAKICDMEVRHDAPYTMGEIKNFAVLLEHGHYEMVANGNILKGCKKAQSHQATRVLTLGKDHTTKCIPLLLIDENDVKASHALTVGQLDEDQMYYLGSRGLTKKQSIGLLSVGYFLPVLDLIEDKDLKQQLQQEMESKVGLYGNQ